MRARIEGQQPAAAAESTSEDGRAPDGRQHRNVELAAQHQGRVRQVVTEPGPAHGYIRGQAHEAWRDAELGEPEAEL